MTIFRRSSDQIFVINKNKKTVKIQKKLFGKNDNALFQKKKEIYGVSV